MPIILTFLLNILLSRNFKIRPIWSHWHLPKNYSIFHWLSSEEGYREMRSMIKVVKTVCLTEKIITSFSLEGRMMITFSLELKNWQKYFFLRRVSSLENDKWSMMPSSFDQLSRAKPFFFAAISKIKFLPKILSSDCYKIVFKSSCAAGRESRNSDSKKTEKMTSDQSYKHFTIVNYDSRVIIWGIFKSGTTLEL